jgi:hypothetical protein
VCLLADRGQAWIVCRVARDAKDGLRSVVVEVDALGELCFCELGPVTLPDPASVLQWCTLFPAAHLCQKQQADGL